MNHLKNGYKIKTNEACEITDSCSHISCLGSVYVCICVFQSVTAYGRAMIEQTKQEVEQHYNITNGCQNDAEVNTYLYIIKDHTRRQGRMGIIPDLLNLPTRWR